MSLVSLPGVRWLGDAEELRRSGHTETLRRGMRTWTREVCPWLCPELPDLPPTSRVVLTKFLELGFVRLVGPFRANSIVGQGCVLGLRPDFHTVGRF